MKFIKIENGYILRLNHEEKLVESILSFCEQHKVNTASVSGIGGVSVVELGYYDLSRKEYYWRNFYGLFEITSLMGNIAIVDSKPFLHSHMTISDTNFQVFGGHLKEAVVGPTCELMINTHDKNITRMVDDDIGLKLLNLEEE